MSENTQADKLPKSVWKMVKWISAYERMPRRDLFGNEIVCAQVNSDGTYNLFLAICDEDQDGNYTVKGTRDTRAYFDYWCELPDVDNLFAA